jgi:hypothetical protein
VGTPHEGQPEPAPRRRDEAGDEREGGGQDGGDTDALEDPGEDERGDRATRLDAGQQQDRAAGQVGDPARRERAQAADPVDHDAGDEGGGDLDDRRGPDDQSDQRIGDTRPGECQRK